MQDQTPPPMPTEPQMNSKLPENDPYEPLEGKSSFTGYLDALLKTPNRLQAEIHLGNALPALKALVLITLFGLLCYGLITGMFSGGVQLVWAPLKVIATVLASALLCLPSLYIFISLAGIEMKPLSMMAQGMTGLALTSVLLLGLAPVLFLFTVSTESLVFMGLLHLILFFVAGGAGAQRFLNSLDRYIPAKSFYPGLWLCIFTLVLCQMSTTLRPILGSSEDVFTSEKQFFLVHWLDVLNAR